MDFFAWVNRRFGNPLEWSSAAKATMLMAATLAMHSQYTLWAHYCLVHPELSADAIQAEFLQGELPVFHGLLLTSFLLCLLLPLLWRLFGDSTLYEHLAANYYGLSHCYFAWLIGTLSLPAGIVLAGAPVLGFIFFHRSAVVLAFINATLALLVISLLSAWGSLPYSPVIRQFISPDGHVLMFWAGNFIFYSVPHLLFLFGLAYLVLRRWREREDQAHTMSRIDPLTGLFNRRSILIQLGREQERSVQQDSPMAVVMVDLDHFKQINDTWGHEAGDYVLIAAAEVLQKNVRQNDRVGRYGGEEFLLVLPGADLEGARQLAERCRQQLEVLEVLLFDGRRLRVSASMGLCCNQRERTLTPEMMLRRADKALYAAKESGRNRVVPADD